MSADFYLGMICGALLFDVLWRITNHFANKLIAEQRNYIDLLRLELGLGRGDSA
jgi:hypothetical protein